MTDERKIPEMPMTVETNGEEIELSAGVPEYARKILDEAPEVMTNFDVLFVATHLMLAYIRTPERMMEVLNTMVPALLKGAALAASEDGGYDGECDCPKCIARRQANAH